MKPLSKHYTRKPLTEHNKDILDKLIKDIDLDKFSRKIGQRRKILYINLFTLLEKWFNHKPLEKISLQDMEAWYLDVKQDKILNKLGKPYTANSKAGLLVQMRTFWKWLKGDNEFYPEEVKHFRPDWQRKAIKKISKKDVEKLAHHFKSFKYTFATLFLFDSGFRREEFMRMKVRNLSVQTRENGEQYYLAECETSKTTPRKIAVALYPEVYGQYLKEFCHHKKPDEPLVDFNYFAYREALNDASEKVLGMRVTMHDLRKASATYFAGILKNNYRINKKYGWTMSSSTSNIYIDAAGIPEDESVELVEQSQVSELKRDNERLKKQFATLQESVAALLVKKVKERKAKMGGK